MGIDEDELAGLRVLQLDEANGRKLDLPGIGDADRGEVVAFGSGAQLLAETEF